MAIQMYHNPRCSKSRATLAILAEQGIEPEIIEYLNDPPNETTLKKIQAALNCAVADMVRKKEAPYSANGLESASDDGLIKAIAKFPILLERPIVINGNRAAIGRPPENVLEIL
mgnify:CR=1 FL=1